VHQVKPERLLLALLLLVLLVLPIWLYRYVPLGDYPNHLARMEILSFYDHSPHLQDLYIRDRRLLPDLGMDMVVPFLRQFFSLEVSGKLFLTGLLLLYSAGTVALGAALHGRLTMRALLLWPSFYNSTLLWGLINYVSGVCLFLLWAALLIYTVSTDDRRPRLANYALLIAGAVLCYLAHLTAFMMCCVTWGMLVIRSFALQRRVAMPLLLCGISLILPIALYAQLLVTGSSVRALDPALTHLVWAWPSKLTHVAIYTRGYNWREDVLPTLLLLGAFGYCLVRARNRPWLPMALWPALGLFAVYLVLPLNANADTWGLDARFFWPACVFLVFALPASGWTAREKGVLALVTFLAWGLRVEALSANWKALSSATADIVQVLDQLPAGARLYPVCGETQDADVEKTIRALCHVAEYAIVTRQIVDPALFTMPGGNSIIFRTPQPRYRQEGVMNQFAGYDYVWSIEPPAQVRDYLNSHADPVGTAGGFVLWRLRKG
jgi:hypothetical protein